ncbi:MAG: peptidoglycan D,D-transpeptidase FtsI family protein [Ilumatobacteraceae bacterium]
MARRQLDHRGSRLATLFTAGQPRRRLLIALVVMLAILAAVLVKVGLLQTIQGETLRSAATQQWTRDRTLPAQRGAIFDRNGNELALSVPASTVTVNPRQVVDAEGTAELFARTLGLDARRQIELRTAMEAKDLGFLYVARQVDTDHAQQLADLDLAGVTIYAEDRRILPGGNTGRSVVGRTDIDGNGTAGLELQYDHVLRGQPGETTTEVAPGGRSIAGSQVTSEPLPGHDIILTIDSAVQYAVEQALLKRVAETGARGAQGIVMSSKTGEIIAMASVRINDDGVYEIPTGNYAAVDAYEPGSVGKVITIAGGLNEGVVTPETEFLVPWRKQFTNKGDFLSDAVFHEEQLMTVEQILVKSSNIGTITVSEQMGFAKQYDYLRAFGFGEVTALDFPQESQGILHPWETWEGTEKFTVAYGQYVASSPIQLIAAVNTVANDGRYIAPKLIAGIVGRDGEVNETPSPPSREVVSERVAEQMQAMMKEVVCSGTATQAQVPGLSIAGKTGTGYIAQPEGGYVKADGSKDYYASFVGFLPAEDPQVTILISIDDLRSDAEDRFGGTVSAPVFRDLAPRMVNELGIQAPAGSTGCPE